MVVFMGNMKEPEPPQQRQIYFVDRVEKYLQILRNFVASDDEVYIFEDNMASEECTVVHQLCQNMGLGSRFTGHGNGQKLCVYKIKEGDSNSVVMLKKKKEEKQEQPQHQNPIVDESTRIQISQILENFLSSNDEVYNFEANLSGEERGVVHQLCQKMGLIYKVSGRGIKRKISVHKTKKEVIISPVLESLPLVTFPEESNKVGMLNQITKKEELEPPQRQNPIVDESIRIWISRILENFLASKDEVYNFEDNLSGEERSIVHDLSQKLGLCCSFSGHGIKRKISVRKTKKEIDSTTVHSTFSVESNQVGMPTKAQNKVEPEPHQHQNPIVDESRKIWISQRLENFLASKDEVYNFEDKLSAGERSIVNELTQKMGLSCTFSGRGIKRKTCIHKPHFSVSEESNLVVMPSKRQKKEKPDSSLHQNPTVNKSTRKWISQILRPSQNTEGPKTHQHENPNVHESTMIRISQILEAFSVSKDKTYNFEAKLSPEECAVVHQLSRKMGFRVKKSGHGIKHKISVHKIRKKVGTNAKIERLPRFTFSEESKQVLGGLLMHYPPGGEEFLGEMIEIKSVTTDKTNRKEDDFFGRPHMSKDEIAKKLLVYASRMKNLSDVKLINEKRSKLPVASFKDVITSTVESHQVVLISGETGCGKTTQVPQFILDHMWGKGEVCKIVCTQPRRISATSVSERIAVELGETVGDNVGYKIRLESKGGRQSSIVLCTTGILLKVLVSKGSTSMKDGISGITHIIMDEIHERDRYSDLILAILREMLPSYPNLRLILMSATVDAEKFSKYFGDCPTIHVPGFTYPVKTFYLEDVLSIVISGEHNHLDNNHVLSKEEKLSLDEAINLAWSNDEWYPLLEFISSKGSPTVIDYQHALTGLTPLMVSSGKGKVGDMCMLLSLGANCHLRAKDGTTALEIAVKENQKEAGEILKKHMSNDFSSNEGKNLLDKYLSTVNPELVDVFLIEQLILKICTDSKEGGILVFLPGWDEINRTRAKLLASSFFNDTAKFMVIPLHSMVPSMEQKKVFSHLPHGCRKIVLSTNIAETAVTIDDIVYVIDSGRMKEKSYDPYNNVLTLQSSWVSKASAKQREGRAGRCQPGICYHLYSKARAASLPDFRTPEIKRLPIEELCLQVKLLDPSIKIAEFLNKTLDPPVFESIQNAVAALQEMGALSPDENLTLLGEKLGSLSVHPSTSKMLLFAILMNCLDPALTLACASDKDPFALPLSPDEKMRAAAAKSELASLYGGKGDQFAVIAAFECWQNSNRMGLQEKFCSRYFISPRTMKMLSNMREKLATELFRNGLICNDVSSYCMNAHDPGILHAVLVAGMYPKVGKLSVPKQNGKWSFVKTEGGDNVRLNHRSTIFDLPSLKEFDRALVVYDEVTRVDWGMTIRNGTIVGPLPLLLLSTEIAVGPAKHCKEEDKLMSSPDNKVRVIIDRWLDLESTALDVSHIYYLRERILAAISYKVTHSTDVLPPVLWATMNTLACILSCDGLSGIPKISDGADMNMDKPTTAVNATSSSKPAEGTQQLGNNPDGSCTEIINQDAPSKISLLASEAVENTRDQTCHDTAVAWACSTPTEQVGEKNPEESCEEIINHDMPSGVTIFASKDIKNPSNPTSQNAAIGSTCLIPTEHIGENSKACYTELTNHDAPETNVPSF